MMLDLGNTDKLAVFKQDLDKMGVPVRTPDMNKSGADFLVEEGGIRYALAALKGVGEAAMEDIVVERDANGTFTSIQDFTSRINPKSLNKRQLEQLGSAGAFECFGVHRAQMREAAEMVLRHANSLAEERESGQENLFGGGDSGPGLDMPPFAYCYKVGSVGAAGEGVFRCRLLSFRPPVRHKARAAGAYENRYLRGDDGRAGGKDGRAQAARRCAFEEAGKDVAEGEQIRVSCSSPTPLAYMSL